MYKYEMHQHTIHCSSCGKADPARTVKLLKEAGFSGMVLTNHFFHGNTGINRNLDWKRFVSFYENDYLIAKWAGEKLDFDVIFGLEEHVGDGKEVLLYGITPDFVYAHPEMIDGELSTISNAVRDFGGLVFQAHPYRSRDYIKDPMKNLDIQYLDGIEAYNYANPDGENELAFEYAKEHNLLMSAGSDAHLEQTDRRFYVGFDRRIRTSSNLVDALRENNYTLGIER